MKVMLRTTGAQHGRRSWCALVLVALLVGAWSADPERDFEDRGVPLSDIKFKDVDSGNGPPHGSSARVSQSKNHVGDEKQLGDSSTAGRRAGRRLIRRMKVRRGVADECEVHNALFYRCVWGGVYLFH